MVDTPSHADSSPIRAIVCGGRDFDNVQLLNRVLDDLALDEICHGAARGADTLAGAWADSHGVPCVEFPANWKTYGRAAGAIRNAVMLSEFQPDVVVAFPGGRGTAHMVRIARAAGIDVIEIEIGPDYRAFTQYTIIEEP